MPERRLYLLRHAKSSWADDGLIDHDRPLAPRGEQSVGLLAAYCRDAGVRPQLVLCSSARRALDTLEGVATGLGDGVEVSVEGLLYGATSTSLLRRLRSVPEGLTDVMVVGHNPGIGDLAKGLVGEGEPALVGRMRVKFPTGGLATLAVDGPWAGLNWGAAALAAFVVPKELG